jgi:uncharacterized protein YciI
MKCLWIAIALLFIGLPAFAQGKIPEPETFKMQVGDSTYVMQKYFIVFLKRGPETGQSPEVLQELQLAHLAHLRWLAEENHISMAGPFGEDGDIRGIVIYNTATRELAEELAKMDPSVKAGRLVVEVHSWWAAKGSSLR